MPSFSVLVPVYNESKTIKTVLDNVCSLDFIDQVIVVDDGSDDESFEIIQRHDSPKIQRQASQKPFTSTLRSGNYMKLRHTQAELFGIMKSLENLSR